MHTPVPAERGMCQELGAGPTRLGRRQPHRPPRRPSVSAWGRSPGSRAGVGLRADRLPTPVRAQWL